MERGGGRGRARRGTILGYRKIGGSRRAREGGFGDRSGGGRDGFRSIRAVHGGERRKSPHEADLLRGSETGGRVTVECRGEGEAKREIDRV